MSKPKRRKTDTAPASIKPSPDATLGRGVAGSVDEILDRYELGHEPFADSSIFGPSRSIFGPAVTASGALKAVQTTQGQPAATTITAATIPVPPATIPVPVNVNDAPIASSEEPEEEATPYAVTWAGLVDKVLASGRNGTGLFVTALVIYTVVVFWMALQDNSRGVLDTGVGLRTLFAKACFCSIAIFWIVIAAIWCDAKLKRCTKLILSMVALLSVLGLAYLGLQVSPTQNSNLTPSNPVSVTTTAASPAELTGVQAVTVSIPPTSSDAKKVTGGTQAKANSQPVPEPKP